MCCTSAVIWTSVVIMGREELDSATGGGGEISFRWEECLADPVAVERWALIFVILKCCLFLSPSLRANLLRPTLRRLLSVSSTYDTVSTQIGLVFDGDSPMLKSEKVGEQ